MGGGVYSQISFIDCGGSVHNNLWGVGELPRRINLSKRAGGALVRIILSGRGSLSDNFILEELENNQK